MGRGRFVGRVRGVDGPGWGLVGVGWARGGGEGE